MPYSKDDVSSIKSKYGFTTHEAHIFISAFNAAYRQYDSEERAFKVAHAAVNRYQRSKRKKKKRAYEHPGGKPLFPEFPKEDDKKGVYSEREARGQYPDDRFGANFPFGKLDYIRHVEGKGFSYCEFLAKPHSSLEPPWPVGLGIIHHEDGRCAIRSFLKNIDHHVFLVNEDGSVSEYPER